MSAVLCPATQALPGAACVDWLCVCALLLSTVLMADIVGFTEASDRCEPLLVMQVGGWASD